MNLESEELKPLVYLVGFLVLSNAGMVAKFIWDAIVNKQSGLNEDIKQLAQSFNKAVIQITKLEVQIQYLNEYLFRVSKMEKDINELHRKLRSSNHAPGNGTDK